MDGWVGMEMDPVVVRRAFGLRAGVGVSVAGGEGEEEVGKRRTGLGGAGRGARVRGCCGSRFGGWSWREVLVCEVGGGGGQVGSGLTTGKSTLRSVCSGTELRWGKSGTGRCRSPLC